MFGLCFCVLLAQVSPSVSPLAQPTPHPTTTERPAPTPHPTTTERPSPPKIDLTVDLFPVSGKNVIGMFSNSGPFTNGANPYLSYAFRMDWLIDTKVPLLFNAEYRQFATPTTTAYSNQQNAYQTQSGYYNTFTLGIQTPIAQTRYLTLYGGLEYVWPSTSPPREASVNGLGVGLEFKAIEFPDAPQRRYRSYGPAELKMNVYMFPSHITGGGPRDPWFMTYNLDVRIPITQQKQEYILFGFMGDAAKYVQHSGPYVGLQVPIK